MQRGKNLYFNVSITSRELQTSRLGLLSAGEANVSVSGGERLGLELLRLVPIPEPKSVLVAGTS